MPTLARAVTNQQPRIKVVYSREDFSNIPLPISASPTVKTILVCEPVEPSPEIGVVANFSKIIPKTFCSGCVRLPHRMIMGLTDADACPSRHEPTAPD